MGDFERRKSRPDDPEAPLWLSSKGEKQGIRRHHLHGIVNKRARQAGIKKRVHPHLFRHTRATHLANSLTEAQMREFFGWTKRSEIPAVYVHLSGRDIDQALLKHYGVKAAEEKQGEEVLKLAECPRCKFVNPAGAKFCMRCSMVLDSREARILDDRLKHADNAQVLLVRYLVEHAPEMLEKILKQPEIKQELEKALSDGGGN